MDIWHYDKIILKITHALTINNDENMKMACEFTITPEDRFLISLTASQQSILRNL